MYVCGGADEMERKEEKCWYFNTERSLESMNSSDRE